MIVRPPTINDVAKLYQLGRHVLEGVVADETASFWPEASLRNAVQSPDVDIFVAEEADDLKGYIIAAYNEGFQKATIENIYVVPAYRGQGVGKALFQILYGRLAERGCVYIATLVPPDAYEAITFYEMNGFSMGKTFCWLDKHVTDDLRRQSDPFAKTNP